MVVNNGGKKVTEVNIENILKRFIYKLLKIIIEISFAK